MGRLRCEPGELFLPRQLAVQDVAELAPPRVMGLLEQGAVVLPAWLRHNLQLLWQYRFVARPMQVHPAAPSW